MAFGATAASAAIPTIRASARAPRGARSAPGPAKVRPTAETPRARVPPGNAPTRVSPSAPAPAPRETT